MSKNWNSQKLGLHMDQIQRSNKKNENFPIWSITNEGGLIETVDFFKTRVFRKDSISYKILEQNEVAYNPTRINVGSIAVNDTGKKGLLSPFYLLVKCHKELSPLFLINYFKSQLGKQKIIQTSESGTLDYLKYENFSNIEIDLPPLPIQEKINEIISLFDSFQKIQEQIINEIKILKRDLIEKLTINGINHQKFKKVNIGKRFLNEKIPESWKLEKLLDILTIKENPIELNDSKKYTRITVKRRHEGIELRDKVLGKEILVKKQFEVKEEDFVMSRRQIVHNACGLVPKEFNNAVVSNEYSIFGTKDDLKIDYFDLFSQSNLFKKTIIVTTHGIDNEKFIFLQDEWLNLKFPLPPIEEQEKILKIISNVENRLQSEKELLNSIEILKEGLIYKILKKKVRVII